MSHSTKIVSLVGLSLMVVPCLLYMFGIFGHDAVKTAALIGTIIWFASSPFWMGRQPEIDDAEIQI